MTLNSRKSTFLCVIIATHHSFCFPNVLWRGDLQTPKTPPGSAPAMDIMTWLFDYTFWDPAPKIVKQLPYIRKTYIKLGSPQHAAVYDSIIMCVHS